MTVPEASTRFGDIAAELAGAPGARVIRAGFAELAPDDGVPDQIARADRELVGEDHDPRR